MADELPPGAGAPSSEGGASAPCLAADDRPPRAGAATAGVSAQIIPEGGRGPRERFAHWFVALVVSLGLFAAFYADVLFRDRNFIFRDAGHFYYPYFKMIAKQWGSGCIPLWNPYENGGEPLLANPTASVLYPLKLLFLLPYPLAYKWYLLGHILLAGATCLVAARGFGAGGVGAVFAALAYAFSGFVIFQLYNIVFLCGAAWLPLAVLAVDRLVRAPSAGWMVLLAVVLALQVLAGDPQVAYLTLLAALPYLLIYHHGMRRGLVLLAAVLGLGCVIRHGPTGWSRAAELLRIRLKHGPLPDPLQSEFTWSLLYAGTIAAIVAASAIVLIRNRHCLPALPGRTALLRLVGAGVLASVLSAVQVLPTMELVRASDRAAPHAPHETVAFSFVPLRLAELVAPAFFGRQFPVNSRWAPFAPIETGIWTPNVYMGLVTVVMAFAGAWFARRSASVLWLIALTLLMLWLAFGKWGGIWWMFDPNLHTPFNAVRDAGKLTQYGASDGLYRLLEETVPGFRSFRFPSKALVFPTLGVALLAGLGIGRVLESPAQRLRVAVLCFTNVVLASLCLLQPWLQRTLLDHDRGNSVFGPYHAAWAQRHLMMAVVHFVIAVLVLWLLLLLKDRFGAKGRSAVGVAFLAMLAVDLFVAHQWLMMTDEQEAIDRKPKVLAAIEADAANDPPELYRIHRTRIYTPERWAFYADRSRDLDLTRWERNTLQPKYGLPFGCHYTTTTGTMSIYDVEFFFAPWVVPAPPSLRERLKSETDSIVYYPRQGYNIWNTRYFVLPKLAKLDDEDRGIFNFLATADGKPCPLIAESAPAEDDYQILKNPEAFPRAWIVHSAEFIAPIRSLRRKDREEPMERLLYRARDAGMPLWKGLPWGEYPLRSVAMLECDNPLEFAPFSTGQPVRPEESVEIADYQPDRVRINVRLAAPGFVILAETYFPGWSATLDGGQAVPIVKANRAMRAVPMPSGAHTIEMRYRSRPFEVGGACSVAGWIGVLAWSLRRRTLPKARTTGARLSVSPARAATGAEGK